MQRAVAGPRADSALQALRIDPVSLVVKRIAVGAGGALFLDGRCSHPAGPIRKLTVSLNCADDTGSRDSEQSVLGWELPPPPNLGGANDYWWAVVMLPPILERRRITVELRARLRNGSRASGILGSIELHPELAPSDLGLTPAAAQPGSSGHDTGLQPPLVAICMATYNPPAHLLRRQIDSIRRQTHRNWVCLISDGGSNAEAITTLKQTLGDDERFQLSLAHTRLGVYDNFERALLMVPPQAKYVAFCDQDDYWRADKLDALLGGLKPGSRLVHSDARIIDEEGRIIDDTLWRHGRGDRA